jgi:hypothetical protein
MDILKENRRLIKQNKILWRENRMLKKQNILLEQDKEFLDFEANYVVNNIFQFIENQDNADCIDAILDEIARRSLITQYNVAEYYNICNKHGILVYIRDYCRKSNDINKRLCGTKISRIFKNKLRLEPC